MNPVVGLDIAKGESQVQMFLDKKMPYKNSVKVEHTVEGLEELNERDQVPRARTFYPGYYQSINRIKNSQSDFSD